MKLEESQEKLFFHFHKLSEAETSPRVKSLDMPNPTFPVLQPTTFCICLQVPYTDSTPPGVKLRLSVEKSVASSLRLPAKHPLCVHFHF